ncbi:MAG: hypothetical protein IMF01_09410 [Proteobacteria bacterium]|nr:hypothetical protein [Pseudomonadota bacterium]
MSTCNVDNIIKIITGSYKKFTVTFEDEDTGERIDFSLVTAAKIIIQTGTGAFVEQAITAPIPSPTLGVMTIELIGTTTAQLDKDTVSFEIETTDNGKTIIYLGKNLMEITERLKTV